MQSLEGHAGTFFKGPVSMAMAVGRTDPRGKQQLANGESPSRTRECFEAS